MPDQLGLISGNLSAGALGRAAPVSSPFAREPAGPAFKESLVAEIKKVDEMQRHADRAIEDFATGERDDLENVIIATQKADTAFRMLLQVRNKVMEAYEEVKQIRV